MIKVGYPVYSVLPSPEQPYPGIIRASRGANPTNAPGNRETAPLQLNATPRVKHPAINVEPWSRFYAQAREEPRTARPKSRKNKIRRERNEKRRAR